MMWSSGTSKEDVKANVVRNAKQVAYKVPVQKIDLRPQYAFFEYKVRTSDNVELVLEGTIFWAVKDVPRMIERTGDPKGDVWYHARSALIQAVSKVDLLEFMASFNTIARAAAADEAFYEERGVKLYSLEVTRYECADGKTASVLQEIIQETTNRINRMQKQRSDNEVEHEELTAKIEREKQRSALIEAQAANEKLQKSVEGESEGTRLAQNTLAFLRQLNVSVPDAQERLSRNPEDVDDFVEYSEFLRVTNERQQEFSNRATSINAMYALMAEYAVAVADPDVASVRMMETSLGQVTHLVAQKESEQEEKTNNFTGSIESSIEALRNSASELRTECEDKMLFDGTTPLPDALEKLASLEEAFTVIKDDAARFEQYQEILKVMVTKYDDVETLETPGARRARAASRRRRRRRWCRGHRGRNGRPPSRKAAAGSSTRATAAVPRAAWARRRWATRAAAGAPR